jgi:hypothetical protein
MATQIYIHQIYYSDETQAQLDKGFLPLDNTNGLKDWYEYWPIRKFLQKNKLDDNAYYGFFSPKFTEKTGLTSSHVFDFIRETFHPNVDAFLFSPVWSHTAFYRNVFEQGERYHAGLMPAAQELCDRSGVDVDLTKLVNHSQNSVFGNYIVAKPAFWRQWLKLGESLFAIAEEGEDGYAKSLSNLAEYGGRPQAPMKVFLQERIASLILATQPFKTIAFDSSYGPLCLDIVNHNDYFRLDLLACDAFKQAYTYTGQPIFEIAYLKKRVELELKYSQMMN